MNASVFGAETAESEDIVQLRNRVRALELRLDRMERQSPAVARPVNETSADAPLAAATPIDTEVAVSRIFKRIAMLCFVLLGALILRVVTQQKMLGADFGTILGFAYAGHLIFLSLIPGRFGGFARESSLFQCSGAALAFIIAIECAMRTQTMSRFWAMAAIAGFALLAIGMGAYQRKAALAGVGVIGGILALVALDMRGITVAVQLAFMVMLAAAGIANSWRERWQWLRTVTSLMMLALLPAAFFFCGREPGVPLGLLAASAGIWCLVLVQHILAFHRLQRSASWLPIMTLWLAGIQYLAHWPWIGPTTGGIGALALGCLLVAVRRSAPPAAGLAGLMATAAFSGAIGWAILDHTGLLCAIGAMALWFVGRRAASDWAAVSATVLMLAAAGVGLAQLLRPPVQVYGLLAMCLSAVVLVVHYVKNGRAGTAACSGLAMRLAPVALAAGLVLLLGLCWELLNRLFAQPAQLLLSQTVALAGTALALTFWGHASHRRAPLFFGLACMGLALAKVMLIDLMRLKSFNMLASVVLVGLASVAVSMILRRRT